MKRLLFINICFIFLTTLNAQTDTSLNPSKTRFNPNSDDYYKTLGKQSEIGAYNRAKKIFDAANDLRVNAEAYMNDAQDQEFKDEIQVILNYLDVLKNNNTMSLETAKWYFKTAEKKMNKAIKSYNKKLRKYKGETPAQTSSSN